MRETGCLTFHVPNLHASEMMELNIVTSWFRLAISSLVAERRRSNNSFCSRRS